MACRRESAQRCFVDSAFGIAAPLSLCKHVLGALSAWYDFVDKEISQPYTSLGLWPLAKQEPGMHAAW